MREKIWYLLVDAKTNEYFTELVLKKYQVVNLVINLIIVIFTSSSIISWAVWNKIPILWAIVVGLTQLLIVIMPIIGLPKYIKCYHSMNSLIKYVVLELEELWYKYENHEISEDDSSKLYFNLRKKIANIDSNSDDIIELNHFNILSKAESKTNHYLTKIK